MKIRNLFKVLVPATLFAVLVCGILTVQAVNAKSNQDQFEKIDQYVESQRKQNNIPGLAIGIVKGEEAVYMKGFGTADSKGRLVTPQTPFIIGSVSKSITALAVMQLVDEGKINLDASIDKYLPWFKATFDGKDQKITVRQLLHHTSGMKDFFAGSVDDKTTTEKLVHGCLNNTQLKTLPGTVSYYSNANYVILGGIVQEVSKMLFKEYITKKIFEPLEMKHSYASKTEALKNNLAAGNKKWFGFPVETEAKNVSFFEYSLPEGYIVSCLEDMTHYVSALINQGRYKNISVASEESTKLLFNTEVQEEYVPAGIEGTKSYYGFGWKIIYNNDKINMYQHTGETSEYHANVIIKPEERIGVIQMANFGGDMTPVNIGIGTADIMTGKEPKESNLISTVYIVERAIVAIIIILLAISIIRLKRWKIRIRKSKAKYIFNLIFAAIVNFIIPIYLLLCFPQMFGSTWASSMLIFPDVSWTVVIISAVLLLTCILKAILTVISIKDGKKPAVKTI